MRKFTVILLALGLLLVSAAAAEETALTGVWYAEINGRPVQMELAEDGAYTLMFPGMETLEGTWEEQGGYICMDSVQPPEITVLGDRLKWTGSPLFFSREETETYTPAEPAEKISEGYYIGYWKSAYVDVDGINVPALAMQDRTDLYIEGTSVILRAPALGDVLVRMTLENGALSGSSGGADVKIELLQDGFLRLTVTGTGEGPQTWYMLPAYSALLDPGSTDGTV